MPFPYHWHAVKHQANLFGKSLRITSGKYHHLQSNENYLFNTPHFKPVKQLDGSILRKAFCLLWIQKILTADYVREKNYFDKTDDSKSASLLKCLTHNYTINIHSHYLYSNIFLKSCSMLFFCLGSQKEESGAQKITKHVQSVISWQNEYASCQTQLFLPLLSWQ